MKAAIVEDEPFAQKELQAMLEEEHPDIEVIKTLDSVDACLDFFGAHPQVDVVFMDIQLADGSSFDLLEEMSFSYPVIFTTAYDAFALKAFEMNSIDYLLKPIQTADLSRAIERFQQRVGTNDSWQIKLEAVLDSMRTAPTEKEYRKHFLVKIGERFKRIEVSEVAYFMVDGNDVELINRSGQRFVIDFSMETLEGEVDPRDFFRINRSVLVHQQSIKEMQRYGNGQMALTLEPELNERVLVSRSRFNDFLNWMGR